MTNDQASDVINFGLVYVGSFFALLLSPTTCSNGKALPGLNANPTALIQQEKNLQFHSAMDYAQVLNKITWSNPVVITMGRRAI